VRPPGEDASDGDETLHSLAMMLGMASRNAAEGDLYQATVPLAYCETLAQRLQPRPHRTSGPVLHPSAGFRLQAVAGANRRCPAHMMLLGPVWPSAALWGPKGPQRRLVPVGQSSWDAGSW
jgi:hypothetical protein